MECHVVSRSFVCVKNAAGTPPIISEGKQILCEAGAGYLFCLLEEKKPLKNHIPFPSAHFWSGILQEKNRFAAHLTIISGVFYAGGMRVIFPTLVPIPQHIAANPNWTNLGGVLPLVMRL